MCVCRPLAVRFHLQGSFLLWMPVFKAFCQSLLPSALHNIYISFFRPEIVFWLNLWSLVACIAEMAEQLPFSCLCKAVVENKIVWRERERERESMQSGEDRIMKIQELVYNRPILIRSRVGSVSTFGCMLQFCIFFLFPPEQCQCAFKYHSIAHKRQRAF